VPAVLGPLVTFPDPQLVEQVAAAEAPRPAGAVVFSWARSIAFALGFALVGAVPYAGVLVSGRQLGIVALLIGFAAGIGAARGGRGRNAQIIGASAAALGYVAALAMAVVWIVGVKDLSMVTKLVWLLLRETFSGMNALFFAIVVYQGWKLPRALT
jgi:hypothetical protein